jgi:surface antigen
MKRVIAALAAASVVLVSLVVASPANAVSNPVLCQGYSGCAAEGRSEFGYRDVSSTEFWRMTRGHNCTNYVGYRLIQAGASSTRPWVGNGNAEAWGDYNADMSDQVPTVGSVAWWDSNRDGAKALGHVAIVEKVTDTKIVISEDNWGGDFYWKTVKRGSSTWPTGFIHFKDADVSSSFPAYRARSLSQTVWTDASKDESASAQSLKPGSTAWVTATFTNTGDETWSGLRLKATGGPSAIAASDWIDAETPTVQKQSGVVTAGTATFSFSVQIPAGVPDGTTYTQTFTPVEPGGAAIAGGDVTMTFTADSREPFTKQPTPTVSGRAAQGQTLTVTTGRWAPVQPDLTYQWLRNGVVISGATAASYQPSSKDVGRSLSVLTTAQAPGYLPVAQTTTVGTIKSVFPNRAANATAFVSGKELSSASGQWRAVVTKSGKFAVINRVTGKTAYSSGKHGIAKVKFRTDGKLVGYSSTGKVVWKAPGQKTGANRMVLTNSGKVMLYSKTNRTKWNSSKH